MLVALAALVYGLAAVVLCMGAILSGCGSHAGTPRLPKPVMYAPEYQQLDAYAAEVAARGGR